MTCLGLPRSSSIFKWRPQLRHRLSKLQTSHYNDEHMVIRSRQLTATGGQFFSNFTRQAAVRCRLVSDCLDWLSRGDSVSRMPFAWLSWSTKFHGLSSRLVTLQKQLASHRSSRALCHTRLMLRCCCRLHVNDDR